MELFLKFSTIHLSVLTLFLAALLCTRSFPSWLVKTFSGPGAATMFILLLSASITSLIMLPLMIYL